MNRMEQLEQVAAKHLLKRYSESKRKIESIYRIQKEKIWGEFEKNMCFGAGECKRRGKTVRYITVSILYSSIVTGNYKLQVAFMNDDFYLDEDPVHVYWAPLFIFGQIDDDMQFFRRKASEEVPGIKEYEVDTIRKQYILNHYFLVMLLLKELFPPIVGEMIREYDCIDDNVVVLFGRYMEKAFPLYQAGENGEIFFDRDR